MARMVCAKLRLRGVHLDLESYDFRLWRRNCSLVAKSSDAAIAAMDQ
ncbi:MAG: hypothetical protein ACOYKN_04175 [Pirellula sp.]